MNFTMLKYSLINNINRPLMNKTVILEPLKYRYETSILFTNVLGDVLQEIFVL